MAQIGIIGRGHVGQNMIDRFGSSGRIVSWDLRDDTPYPSAELAACDFVMICVDTPMLPDGSVNVSNVESALLQIPCRNIVIRSTVPPGTTARLAAGTDRNLCFWPEYVGESEFLGSSWDRFAASEPFAIIGGEPAARRALLEPLLPILGPEVRVFQCASGEAELVKYMENSYLAMKVIFVNEFRALCDSLGLDWHTVREGWLLDPRVERDHTAAFSDERGFGGNCLPKDLAGILDFARSAGIEMTMLSAVQESNQAFRRIRTPPASILHHSTPVTPL